MCTLNSGIIIPDKLQEKYFSSLVNKFFKILPLKETNDSGLIIYMKGLQRELTGCFSLLPTSDCDPSVMDLLGILQYHIEHDKCDVKEVRRDVFRAISICNKLRDRHCASKEERL